MNLIDEAIGDFHEIINDVTCGPGRSIEIAGPDGIYKPVNVMHIDISAMIDPLSGAPLSGRHASITVTEQSLSDAGLTIPTNIPERTKKPYLAKIILPPSLNSIFKIKRTEPDMTLGLRICHLGLYKSL